jgi:uncharacterized protein
MKFSCRQCGECCRRIGKVIVGALSLPEHIQEQVPLGKMAIEFPYKFDNTGKCEMLNLQNRCMVYATRPTICNVNKMHALYYKSTIKKKDFFKMNQNVCKKLG